MRLGLRLAFAALLALAALPAAAQQYPNRPITFIVGYAAGTGGDVLTRYFAEKLRLVAGQPVIVENKAGAGTNIAAEYVARSKPDGYTVFITPANSTFSSNSFLYKSLPFDPIKDFTPVTTLGTLPFLVTVAPELPVKSMKELTAHLKAKGAKGTYGYGNSTAQVMTELYKQIEGLQTLGVAYRATPQALPDMHKGEIDVMFMDATFALQQERQGQLRILAATSAQRSPVAPDFQGMEEAGVKGFDLTGWWAAWLPANPPQDVLRKLESWLNDIVATEETREFLLRGGLAPLKGNSQWAKDYLPKDIEKWGKIIRGANIEAQ
jgi:tripartite-type tricarboxylate transporter receptor subunit TctC